MEHLFREAIVDVKDEIITKPINNIRHMIMTSFNLSDSLEGIQYLISCIALCQSKLIQIQIIY